VPIVTVTHLEMTRPEALRPARPAAGVVERVHDPEVNARLYRDVGARWSWTDRLGWTSAQWSDWAARVRTDVLRIGNEIAGYYELDPAPSGSVEIAIFGLRETHHGRGLGGHLLTEAIRRAWAEPGARRVWVHTCSLDGPHALANYLARGLRVFRVDESPADG
jgi:RimJ/RimL family protein N-acetyltransferase